MEDSQRIMNLDPKDLTPEAADHIKNLAMAVHGELPSKLNEKQLGDLITLDMASLPTQFTVSAGATRRTEVQYCSNNYHLSEQLDTSSMKDAILSGLENLDGADMINRYVEIRSTMLKMCEVKIESTEDWLRELIKEMEIKDGQAPQGRHG